MNDKYASILHSPHHVSKTRPQMSMHDRAAQFSPFAALTGFEASIDESIRRTEAWIDMDEDRKAELDLDQAKQEIEYLKDINPDLYQKLYERMDLETLFFDSVRLFWYETSYSDGQLLQMRLSFKERCEKYQLTHFSEGKTLASTYANWGI